MHDPNPQAEQMAHESMVRNLAAQAQVIWPQEQPLLERYGLPGGARILDAACGTGEITERVAELFPDAVLTGVDVHEPHLERARARCARFGDRVRFQAGDAFGLSFPDGQFDLVLCRHLLQAVPEPGRVLAELRRVARPGGRLHLVAEDYAMMHFHPTPGDADRFWLDGPVTYAESTGADLRSGRKMFTLLRRLGMTGVRVDYLVIDTVRVDRGLFASIWEAWRDGYTDAIAAHTGLTREETLRHFDGMLAAIRDPDGYGVWQLPVITALKP